MNFYLDGVKVAASASITAGATVVAPPSTQFLIGDSNLGVWSDNTGGANSTHWVGQIYSLKIAKVATNTGTSYTPPTTALTSDANTWLLLNAVHINDVWITTDALIGGSGAIAFHTENLAGGNDFGTIRGMNLGGDASYGLENIGALYMNLEDDAFYGTESGIYSENNSYGARWFNLAISTKTYGQSTYEVMHNSGHINLAGTLNMSLGAYGGVMVDSNMQTGEMLIQGASTYNVAAFSMYGDTSAAKYNLIDPAFDNESGSTAACLQISGLAAVTVMGLECQTTSTTVPVQWNPGNGGTGGSLSIAGSSFETNGGSPADIVSFSGSGTPANPVLLLNDSINGTSLTGNAIAPCSIASRCVVKPVLPIPMAGATPTLTVLSGGDTDAETQTETLGASTTETLFASGATAPVNGKVFHQIITQPSGGHSYTFALSAGSGVNLVYPTSGGCGSLPSMPTGTGHSLLLDMLYNTLPSTPEIDVLSCQQTGS